MELWVCGGEFCALRGCVRDQWEWRYGCAGELLWCSSLGFKLVRGEGLFGS